MTFIIAEVGSNWKNEDDLMYSVQEAKRCGADAVKFQAFSASDLYGKANPTWAGNEYALNWKMVPRLLGECKRAGIEFMCTVFNSELVPTINTCVGYHKISSSNMMDIDLLKAVAKTGKQVYLSTGGWDMDHIAKAMSYFEPHQAVPMYCQPDYPARNPDLRCIALLRERFDVGGFSDHTLDSGFLAWSAANEYGADVIEKHVNFLDYKDTPDAPHALNSNRFRRYVLNARDTYEVSMPIKFHDMEMYHYARPVVMGNHLPGEKVRFRYCRVDRPGIYRDYGLDLEGAIAKHSLAEGDVLNREDVLL